MENDSPKRRPWLRQGSETQGWKNRESSSGERGWNIRGQDKPNERPDLSTTEGIKRYWFGEGPDTLTEQGIRQYWSEDGSDLLTPEGVNKYWFGDGPDLSTEAGIREYWQQKSPVQPNEEPSQHTSDFRDEMANLLEEHLKRLYETYKRYQGNNGMTFEEFQRLVKRQ